MLRCAPDRLLRLICQLDYKGHTLPRRFHHLLFLLSFCTHRRYILWTRPVPLCLIVPGLVVQSQKCLTLRPSCATSCCGGTPSSSCPSSLPSTMDMRLLLPFPDGRCLRICSTPHELTLFWLIAPAATDQHLDCINTTASLRLTPGRVCDACDLGLTDPSSRLNTTNS